MPLMVIWGLNLVNQLVDYPQPPMLTKARSLLSSAT